MHDLLRDMGRKIVRNTSPGEPEKYSRLWELKDIYNVLNNHKGTNVIECIIPYNFDYQDEFEGVSFSAETFKGMSNLRFLHLDGDLTGSFEETFEELRWLRWDWCPLMCLPSEFDPQNLVILELPHSKLRRIFKLNMVSPVFEKLQTLNMSSSVDLATSPDFTKLPYLENLNLEGCKNLEEIHTSIGSLVRVVSLNLNSCSNLKILPNSIGNLKALEVLSINSCSYLQALPTELGNIESLKMFNAEGLTVSELPDSIGCLTKLVELNLSYNFNLRTLPDTICKLKGLEVLSIGGCSSLEALPKQLGDIESLKTLKVWGLSVRKLPNSIGRLSNLVHFDLKFNLNLETLPDTICNLRSLEILSVFGCEKLEMLPDQLWKISSLMELDACGASLLKVLPDIESTQLDLSLQRLYLSKSAITTLPSGISQLLNLECLDLTYSRHLLSVAELPPNLNSIWAIGCTSVKSLPNLCNLKQLEMLDLTNCNGLTEIQGLEELTSLSQLYLGGCNSSLLANTLTEWLFQIYSGFEHQITIYTWTTKFPNWIIQSSSIRESTASLDLLQNVSHNYLGMILCFEASVNHSVIYSVKNTASGFIWSSSCQNYYRQSVMMVIVPRTIFSVREGDDRIEVTANAVKIHAIHPLYTREMTTTVMSDTGRHPFKGLQHFLKRKFQKFALMGCRV